MLDLARESEGPQPEVSVCMITYNHEKFIADAIESVLSQDLDQVAELVIGEDCSTDDTRRIVLEYEQRHPARIRVSTHERNLGDKENFKRTLNACRGTYVALLDGDDYWTSRSKLKRQLTLLNTRKDLVACFHSVVSLDEVSRRQKIIRPARRADHYKLEDLSRSTLMPTSAVVFRNDRFAGLPQWFWSAPYGDWVLFTLLAEQGDIGYLDETMSVHRLHGGSVFGELRRNPVRHRGRVIRMQKLLIDHLGAPRNRVFLDGLYSSYYVLAHALVDDGQSRRARCFTKKCLKERGYSARVSFREPFSILFHICFPIAYRALRRILSWRSF